MLADNAMKIKEQSKLKTEHTKQACIDDVFSFFEETAPKVPAIIITTPPHIPVPYTFVPTIVRFVPPEPATIAPAPNTIAMMPPMI
jgi:hypothetical protein